MLIEERLPAVLASRPVSVHNVVQNPVKREFRFALAIASVNNFTLLCYMLQFATGLLALNTAKNTDEK